MPAKECPLCGQAALVSMSGEYRFEPPHNIPGDSIVVRDAQWLHCDLCGEDILSSELEAAIDQERRRRLGLLTPQEIRGIRENAGLSVADMSHLLGVEEQAYTRLETGRSLPTSSSDVRLRQIGKSPETCAVRAAERKLSGEPSE